MGFRPAETLVPKGSFGASLPLQRAELLRLYGDRYLEASSN